MDEGGKWEKLSFWTGIGVSILLIVAGIVSIITFFISITSALSNPLGFLIFVYSILCGVLLLVGTLGKPKATLMRFGFLRGRRLRSLFQLFMGSLCLTAGFSGGASGVSNIVLLVAGFPAVICAPLTFIHGKDHEEIDEEAGVGGGERKSAPQSSHNVSVI